MTDLPKGWTDSNFGELFDYKGGSQPPKSTFQLRPAKGLIRLLQIRDFGSDDKAVYIENEPKWPKCSEGDIMVGRYGASVGKILGGKAGAYNVALVRWIFDDQNLDRGWVRKLLQSDIFQLPLQKISRSAQDGFNKGDLAKIAVRLPPLLEQRRIVRKLDTLSARTTTARTHLTAIAKLVERYKQSALGVIFASLNQASDSVGELTSLVTSGSRGWAKYYSDDGAMFIRVGDTRRGSPNLELRDVQHVRPPADGEGKRTKLRSGDLVISITADLGRVGIVPLGVKEAYVNQHIALVRPIDLESSEFIAWYLISPLGQEQLFENDRGGATMRWPISRLIAF